jgi:phage tail-like protein
MGLGGFRPTLFEIQVAEQSGIAFLCNATQVPAMTMGVIEVPYMGRKIKMAGDRTYAEWTTTLFVNEDFEVRNYLEKWQASINDPVTNIRDANWTDYKKNATVRLYNKKGKVLREYTLQGCWPTDVGTIDLDWNTTDTLATYQVTWAFDIMAQGNQKVTTRSSGAQDNSADPLPPIV